MILKKGKEFDTKIKEAFVIVQNFDDSILRKMKTPRDSKKKKKKKGRLFLIVEY